MAPPSYPGPPSPHVSENPTNSCNERPAVRKRLDPPRTPGRVPADRHLGALPAHARPRVLLRVCDGRAWHAGHDPRPPRGYRPRRTGRALPPRARAGLRGFPDRIRQLLDHALGGKRGDRRHDLQRAARCRAHLHQDDQPGLRRAGKDVSAGSFRARHLPRVRHRGSIRRRVRELRQHLLPGRSEIAGIGAVRPAARIPRQRALLFPAG